MPDSPPSIWAGKKKPTSIWGTPQPAAAPAVDPETEKKLKALEDLQSGGGFFEKIGSGIEDAITGVPTAVLHMGEEAGKVARLPTSLIDNVILRRNADQINNNDTPVLGFLERNLTLPEIMPREGDDMSPEGIRSKAADTFPVTKAIGEGFGRTGAELDPRGGFENLRRNYGRDPIGSLLNDAANISIVASAGGSAALKGGAALGERGGALATAGKGLTKAGEAANTVATLPFKPYQAAAKLPAWAGERAYARNLEAAADGVAPKGRDIVMQKFAKTPKDAQAEILRGKALEHVGGDAIDKRAVGVHNMLESPAEHEALMVVNEKGGPALAAVRAHDPAGFEQYVTDRYKGSLSLEGANLAADITDGVAAPEVVARIEEATKAGTEGQLGRQQRQAAYIDKHPEQAGYEPNQAAVAAADNPAAAAYAIENAPARLKPILGENRAATKHLVGVINDLRKQGLNEAAAQVESALNDLPTTLEGLKAAGIDAEHFFHTQESTANKGARVARNPGLPRTIKPGSERLRKGEPVYDRSALGQARGEREVLVAEVRRQTAERIAELPGAVEHLGQGALTHARTAEDARQLGYVPWSPGSLFDTQGRVRPLSDIEAAAGIEHTTMFMPRPLFDQFRNYFEPIRGQGLGVLTDVPNRAYYMARLQLSPAYITGQVLGNFLGLGPASSSAPVSFWKNVIKEIKQHRATGEFSPEVMDAPRVFQAGGEVAEQVRRIQDVGLPGKTGARRVTAKANDVIGKLPNFRAARFLDNLSRAAYYMTELQKRGSAEAALEATLRGMGEFDKFSPFERDYVRRVMPMYAWHREITKIAFHLAEDHPLRVAWTLHLGNTVGQQDGPLPDFYKDTVGIGPVLVGTGQAFPFGEVATEFKGPLGGAGKYLGPTPKLIFQNYTGESASTGKPFSRPFDPDNPAPSAPSLLKQVSGMIPQVDTLAGLIGNKDTARYSTGEEILVTKPMTPEERAAYIERWHREHPGERVKFPKVTIPGNGGVMEALSNLAGIPLYDRAAIEQQAQDKVDRDKAKLTPKGKAPAKSAGKSIWDK